jgi:hypothetical protein
LAALKQDGQAWKQAAHQELALKQDGQAWKQAAHQELALKQDGLAWKQAAHQELQELAAPLQVRMQGARTAGKVRTSSSFPPRSLQAGTPSE